MGGVERARHVARLAEARLAEERVAPRLAPLERALREGADLLWGGFWFKFRWVVWWVANGVGRTIHYHAALLKGPKPHTLRLSQSIHQRTSSSLRYIWIQQEKTRSNEAGGSASVSTSAQMNSTLPKCPFSSRFWCRFCRRGVVSYVYVQRTTGTPYPFVHEQTPKADLLQKVLHELDRHHPGRLPRDGPREPPDARGELEDALALVGGQEGEHLRPGLYLELGVWCVWLSWG